MQDIKDLTLKELEDRLKQFSSQKYHAKQIFSWIYKKSVFDFMALSDIPEDLRVKLKGEFSIISSKLIKLQKSSDGTQKLLLQFSDKSLIECVVIPAEGRVTGCVSTQVGCKFGCRFCASGLSGFKRNLTCAEIIEEVLYLKEKAKPLKLTHLVFMGTGEPLDNYVEVVKAIRIINSPEAFNIGARRITISTCGIIPAIQKLSEEKLQIELSVSLHAAVDSLRLKLMPINKRYPLKDLINTCKEYSEKTNRQITFEYIMIKNLNSNLENAEYLVKLLGGWKLSKVNLIPSNFIKELKIAPPNKIEVLIFKDYLVKHGVNVTLRRERGQDIDAACGQLRLAYAHK
ncbi:MAG: 23S rRNA (adenine(2503)-C(2))-methyltransferase RlmN [Candidatus Omnitrophica bacterium]|nr:23S rRNA (adenine(2503)-C(2))-methyltransferase RlmN [Candidatus Omnitrophota bacterium]